MTVTIKQIEQLLAESALRAMVSGRGYAVLFFRSHAYRNGEGEGMITVIVHPINDGRFLRVVSPSLYEYPSGPHLSKLLEGLTLVNFHLKAFSYEFDAEDGEVRIAYDLVLEDAGLTAGQLASLVKGLPAIVDDYDPVIRKILSDGVVDLSLRGTRVTEAVVGDIPEEKLRELLEKEINRRWKGGCPEEEQ